MELFRRRNKERVIPDVFVKSAGEAQQSGRLQRLHGGSALMLVFDQIVRRVRQDDHKADQLDGISSFLRLYYLDLPEVAFPRKKLYKGLRPAMTSRCKLWVSVTKNNGSVDFSSWLESQTHAKYAAGTRGFDPAINARQIAILQASCNDSAHLPHPEQKMLHDELELQLRRRIYWQNMNWAEAELLYTPAIFEWHVDPSQINATKSRQTWVLDGHLPYSDLKNLYMPRSVSNHAINLLTDSLKRFHSKASLIPSVSLDIRQ